MIKIQSEIGSASYPDLLLGYTFSRESRNNIHPLVTGSYPGVTIRPATARTGTLRLFYKTRDAALSCEFLHALGDPLTYTDTDFAGASMTYVPTGALNVELDAETARRWVVSVPFQQVTA